MVSHSLRLKYKKIIILAILALLPVFIWVYYRFDPSNYIIFPKCPVQTLFSIPCPGCGSQRAIHSLLHFDLAMAMKYNALAVIFIPLLIILSVSALLREKYPAQYQITHSSVFSYSLAVIVVLWWILRIVFHWYV